MSHDAQRCIARHHRARWPRWHDAARARIRRSRHPVYLRSGPRFADVRRRRHCAIFAPSRLPRVQRLRSADDARKNRRDDGAIGAHMSKPPIVTLGAQGSQIYATANAQYSLRQSHEASRSDWLRRCVSRRLVLRHSVGLGVGKNGTPCFAHGINQNRAVAAGRIMR